MPVFDSAALNPGVRPREVMAWAGYDFANSGYTTVVLTAVFNAYFVGVVAGNADWATFAWTLTLGISNVLVMLAMPMIGAYADLRARKKWLLAISTGGCVAGTAALAAVGPGDVALAAVAITVSNFFFMVGVGLVAAFLPELARPEALGKVSGWGWGFGYVGGLHHARVVPRLRAVGAGAGRDRTGIRADDDAHHRRGVRVRGGAGLADRAGARGAAGGRARRPFRARRRWRASSIRCAISTAIATSPACCSVASSTRPVSWSVIALAAIYAQEVMKFTFVQTMTLVLVVNVTAAIGAFAFGYVQDALGTSSPSALTLLMWLAMVTVAGLATSAAMFWVAANLAGLAMGSSQSAGRALAAALRSAGAPRRVLRPVDVSRRNWRPSSGRSAMARWSSRRTTTIASASCSRGSTSSPACSSLATIDIARGRRAAEASAALP